MPYTTTRWKELWDRVLKAAGPVWSRRLRKAEPYSTRPGTLYTGKLTLSFPARYPAARRYCKQRVVELEKLLQAETSVRWAVFVRKAKDKPAPEDGLNNCFFKTESTTLHDELRFRSPAEIAIYDELKRRRLLFYPNPAAVFGGKYPTKKEPDFLIFTREGKCGILEAMGATFHTNATKDHERARLFKEFGILCIEFFDAQRCMNDPEGVVEEFLALVAKH